LRRIEIGRRGSVGLEWDCVQGRKKALTCGAGLSAAGGEVAGTVSEWGDAGLGLDSELGRIASPRPLLLFLFFPFSYFLFSFLSFAKILQINSKHFLNFSKLHSKVFNQ
jgi:hypothetical protein